jgi:hypothetical protein
VQDALFDEWMGLSFTIDADPRQRSHSRVLDPLDSRQYFIVSDSRLPFSSPPTTRRAKVEVLDPASTRDYLLPCLENSSGFITFGRPRAERLTLGFNFSYPL